MMRRNGKLLEACEDYGRAPGVDTGAAYEPRPRRDRSREPQMARNVDFDLFTGKALFQ
jgi:hypothetical protein